MTSSPTSRVPRIDARLARFIVLTAGQARNGASRTELADHRSELRTLFWPDRHKTNNSHGSFKISQRREQFHPCKRCIRSVEFRLRVRWAFHGGNRTARITGRKGGRYAAHETSGSAWCSPGSCTPPALNRGWARRGRQPTAGHSGAARELRRCGWRHRQGPHIEWRPDRQLRLRLGRRTGLLGLARRMPGVRSAYPRHVPHVFHSADQ